MSKKKNVLPGHSAFDRRPTPHFRGRTSVLNKFRILRKRAMRGKEGTTFIIHGAPGAGKTALLDQCQKRAEKDDWNIVKLYTTALWNPDDLLHCLGKSHTQITGLKGEIGVGAEALGHANIGFDVQRTTRTMMKILQDGKKPLLLILDEAQALGYKDVVPSEMKGVVTSVLNKIHNGDLGKAAILLAGGLKTTLDAFEIFGISRTAMKCVEELGPLSEKSTRAIIYAWLTNEGGAKGDVTKWVGSITKESNGWPQHIVAYVESAIFHLMENGGHPTPTGLNEVLHEGRIERAEYYEQRVRRIEGGDVICLAKAILDLPAGKIFKKETVMSELESKHRAEKAEGIFCTFIEKGVIAEDGRGYSIPISSMHDWLKSELKLYKERIWEP